MRFNAPRKPEVREKHIEYTEKIGDAGTASHESIHIGRSVFQLFPGTDMEAAAQPENHRSGKRPQDIPGSRYHVREEHADNQNRYGQNRRPYCPAFQGYIPGIPDFLRFFSLLSRMSDDQVITCITHGITQGFRSTFIAAILYRDCSRRIIYGCTDHAWLTAERLLHPCGTCRAAHSKYRKIFLRCLVHLDRI